MERAQGVFPRKTHTLVQSTTTSARSIFVSTFLGIFSGVTFAGVLSLHNAQYVCTFRLQNGAAGNVVTRTKQECHHGA